MKVLVDTSVWSLALRRRQTDLDRAEREVVEKLRELIGESRIVMVGPVRQEILSGVRRRGQFRRLRDRLRAFEDERLESEDYEAAAEIGNQCREAGLAVSAVDLLLCAVAMRRSVPLLTLDADFARYAEVLPLKLLPADPS